ncbi:VWA domain-containing protein [Pelagicoccus mobilis]|uniref:VWA domain-containing protein n=1 Tax=Pelagicoccus mobilis TaxID=415221 RepID=A0A934RYB3_9BACT|nr:VWA domain-containing protein [Pelagicoccus mobilis]MBK1877484.1 VWA domain-containing protein [Pelagicoccus mobilis]
MSFAYPWVFLLLLLWGFTFLRVNRESGIRVASNEQWKFLGRGRARHLWLLRVLELLFFVLLVAAMARPQVGSNLSVEEAEGIAIEMLVDVSSSMDQSLVVPGEGKKTRMEVAKELVEQFIAGDGEQLMGRPNDLIGLISFARYADTRSPLTFGHKALVQIVRDLKIQDRPNEDGTAYGDALALACARLKNLDELKSESASRRLSEIKSRVVVLLTDGENNSGNHLPLESAGLAKEWDSRIYSISLGDAEGLGIEKTGLGESPLSSAEQVLSRISEETGGLFRRASGYESLKSVYAEIDELERTRIETRSFTIVSEIFWLPALLALTCLVIRTVLWTTWLRIAS